jgi:peptidoglycan/xylan/chitin deacetylase (PgdA/CDA1 family)
MMRAAVVIGCSGPARALTRAVERARAQSDDAAIVLVALPDLDDAGRRSVRAVVDRFSIPFVSVPGGPGAAWNAGVRMTDVAYVACVEADDLLAPPFLGTLVGALERDPAADVALSWVRRTAGAVTVRVDVPGAVDLETALALPSSTASPVIRREAWSRLGGFDEHVPGFELHELLLRVLAAGRRVALVERPLVERPVDACSRSRRALDDDQVAAAYRAIVDRHRPAYDTRLGQLLAGSERRYRALVVQHGALVDRRAGTVRALTELDAELATLRAACPGEGLDWGDLRRKTPVSRDWGYDRGTPVDRHYIEAFLERHAGDIRGRVLEVQEDDYSRRFGGDRVERVDVVDLDPTNPRATVIADLRGAPALPSDAYDCVVLTQTLHVIDDMHAALTECRRVLKPGGVLLATLPAASRVCLEYGADGDFWRVTEAGARRLAGQVFGPDAVETRAYGNVLATTAFLYGFAAHELGAEEFDWHDPFHPLIVGVRAVKSGGCRPPSPRIRYGAARGAGVILLYHRVADVESVHRLAVPPLAFREQMRYLVRACHPMGLDDLAEAAACGAIPPGAVSVTFDDGYLDNLDCASPVLVDLDIPATFFVTTGSLAAPHEPWWETLERVLCADAPLPRTLDLELPGRRLTLPTGTDAERGRAHEVVHAALVACGAGDRERALQAVVTWSGRSLPLRETHRLMTGDEVRRLAARGHGIGAHGVAHVALTGQDAEGSANEAARARADLERLLGTPVSAFAYPYGAVDAAARERVRAAGYALAATCERRPVGLRPDPLMLPRLEVTTTDIDAFATLLSTLLAKP